MKNLLIIAFCFLFIGIVTFQIIKEDPVIDFLNSLNARQRAKAVLDLDDPKKEDWHFFPSTMFVREGISIEELNSEQRDNLHELLQSMLSKSGYETTMEIIELENVLRTLSGDTIMRNPEKYFTTFYGNPISDDIWSMSFEGHHISLNLTVSGEEIIASPRFFGANPARIPSGAREGDRTLDVEEDMGFGLLNSMDKAQLEKTIFRKEPYREIVSQNLPKITPMDPVGISYSELNTAQQKMLIELIDQYISVMPENVAKKRREKVMLEDLNDLHFGWVGANQLGAAHYFRIQGKTFLIEFDNSQNNANHIHTVWRDFDGDFGRDLIHEHLQTSPHHN